MARNDDRRQRLADAGLAVLAREGARGLTHRALDREAGVPTGTASNYFRTRAELVHALADRIGQRLAPDPDTVAGLRSGEAGPAMFADHVRDIVRRLGAEREVTLALFELRLEAVRRPEVAEVMGEWLRTGFAADVAYNRAAGLPGGPAEIALFHYAVDGLLLDRLTLSIDPDTPTDTVVDALVDGLLPPAQGAGATSSTR
ncbi:MULTISPECIES: TetR/AcrR family transcriptional regulator [Pseudonocardia]|jgi:AcrR family transcriptional regulator|uniref:AcrR family transcriptional regulator n=1 Tax=Pseudonocardia alni TaxID=33907 RepID=A0A852VZU3_PSEA5|nr:MULTISPECIES: TetR/AcrR family transcriptional regulator [Pseudonocardia]MCO7192145.1 TetR family transcriptional regulator [Pseudonocardia sp. McavD-2-B]NYG01789.1 AcrR family transcriptional regulator [Pseudonocardia antarctica]